MGLDISVYSNVKLVKTLDEVKRSYLLEPDMDSMYDDYLFIFANPSFLKQADGFETGFYTGILEDSFRAGSYSGYSHFREKIAMVLNQVTVNQIWENLEKHADLPFIDLINFSDCEGIIGPKTSEKLFHNFKNNLEKARNLTKEGPYDFFLDTYVQFMNAFETAAKTNGIVRFH